MNDRPIWLYLAGGFLILLVIQLIESAARPRKRSNEICPLCLQECLNDIDGRLAVLESSRSAPGYSPHILTPPPAPAGAPPTIV